MTNRYDMNIHDPHQPFYEYDMQCKMYYICPRCKKEIKQADKQKIGVCQECTQLIDWSKV